MTTYDEKVDNAVHAAFAALGLSVTTHTELADELNTQLTKMCSGVVTGDEDKPVSGKYLYTVKRAETTVVNVTWQCESDTDPREMDESDHDEHRIKPIHSVDVAVLDTDGYTDLDIQETPEG